MSWTMTETMTTMMSGLSLAMGREGVLGSRALKE